MSQRIGENHEDEHNIGDLAWFSDSMHVDNKNTRFQRQQDCTTSHLNYVLERWFSDAEGGSESR